jgi:ABC-type transport system substrate-binding protein
MQARLAALDPAEFAAHENLAALAFERLVSWNALAQPEPALAVTWRHDAEFKRWEFQLRPGVKFHDGSPLTAATAAAALERLGAVAMGETLVIRSDQSAPKLLELLAGAGQSIWKRSAEGALVGTGPFRLLTWDPGRRAVFAADDNYWGGRAYLDAVEVEMGRSSRDQALDFDLNKADIIELAPGDVRRAQQSGKKVWTSAPLDLVALVFDPAVDERVREAVALSIDRATIQNVLLQRQGAAAGGLLPQWLSGYAFLFPDARDLGRARQAASHASAPLTITYDPQDATVRSIGERIAVNAHEAGVTIRPVAASQIASARLARVRIASPDAVQALLAIGAPLGSAAPASFATPYDLECSLLQGGRIVPLFHLPEIYGLSARVRNWTATRWGEWKLDSVWLSADKP